MSVSINVSNSWKYTKNIYVNVSSAWKTIFNIYTNLNNVWKPLYAHWYEVGDWSSCSVTCGGGTQTRSVTCYRSDYTNHNLDKVAVLDTFCSKAGINKPNTSQSCNTQDCNECLYDSNNIWKIESALINMGEGVCTGYDVSMILWNSQTVFTIDNAQDTNATVDGYIYTRSTLQSDTGSIRCPSGLGQISKRFREYTVCRVPV